MAGKICAWLEEKADAVLAAAPALPAVVAGARGRWIDFVSIAMREGMHGMFSFLAGLLDQHLVHARRMGGRKLPSGAVRRPSLVPVTPMNPSALS